MRVGGNGKFRAYLDDKGIDPGTDIREKYAMPDVELYALRLRAQRDGKPLPTALPSGRSKGSSSGTSGASGETALEREARLRREAEERLREKIWRERAGRDRQQRRYGQRKP